MCDLTLAAVAPRYVSADGVVQVSDDGVSLRVRSTLGVNRLW
jgi:hypothetical protein